MTELEVHQLSTDRADLRPGAPAAPTQKVYVTMAAKKVTLVNMSFRGRRGLVAVCSQEMIQHSSGRDLHGKKLSYREVRGLEFYLPKKGGQRKGSGEEPPIDGRYTDLAP